MKIQGIQYPDNFYDLFDNYDIYDFLICLIFVVVNAVYNIVQFLTCDYFTPCNIIIITLITELYYSLKSFNNAALNVLSFVFLLLIAFTFLVYIEIIELNIFNISYNTKKNIESRCICESLFGFDDSINPIEENSSSESDITSSY